MPFTQPCFVRKNTIELRKKLEDLGYTYSNCDNINLDYIVTFPSTGKYSCFASYHFNNEHFEKIWKIKYIDCSDNEELFLALAALRDDTDKNQYFICDKVSVTLGKTYYPCDYLYYQYGEFFDKQNWHKATVKEIIKHFK